MTNYEIIMRRKYANDDCTETVYHEDSYLAAITTVQNLLMLCRCSQRVDVVAYENGADYQKKICEASFVM